MSAFCEVQRLIQRLPISRFSLLNYAQRSISSIFKNTSNSWACSQTSSIKHHYNGYKLISFDQPKRFKYSKSSKKDDDESDGESIEDVPIEDVPSKLIKASVPSLRVDAIIKAGIGLARNKVEVLFYKNNLRLNGKKIVKKGHQVALGDELDVITGFSELDPSMLEISRIVLISVNPDEDSGDFKVQLRRYKSLLIENYEAHPWKSGAETENNQ